MKHNEYALQVRIVKYLNYSHPNIIFICDQSSNYKLTASQQLRSKLLRKNNFACPDLLILESNNKYKGLAIELKKETPYLRDGITLKKQRVLKKTRNGLTYIEDHLENQDKALKQLRSKGYFATFCWSFDDFIRTFEDYLKNRLD